jgi:hypothetical protein
MRDYFYAPDEGPQVPVSEMMTADIQDILAVSDCVIHNRDGNETVENVLERLRIELVIRNLGL